EEPVPGVPQGMFIRLGDRDIGGSFQVRHPPTLSAAAGKSALLLHPATKLYAPVRFTNPGSVSAPRRAELGPKAQKNEVQWDCTSFLGPRRRRGMAAPAGLRCRSRRWR